MIKSNILPESCYVFKNLSRESIINAHKENSTITGLVEKILYDKEELLVKLGQDIFAYLPFNEVTIYPFRYSKNPKRKLPLQICMLLHKEIRVKVTSITDSRIELSRKDNLNEMCNFIKNCDIVPFKITHMTTTMVFGDCGNGVDGCMNIGELSRTFIKNTSEYVHKGQLIWVKVLHCNENNSFALSYKETFPRYDPENFKEGDAVVGKVGMPVNEKQTAFYVSISPQVYGIFTVRDWMPHFNYGDTVECSITSTTPNHLKLRFLSKA